MFNTKNQRKKRRVITSQTFNTKNQRKKNEGTKNQRKKRRRQESKKKKMKKKKGNNIPNVPKNQRKTTKGNYIPNVNTKVPGEFSLFFLSLLVWRSRISQL